LTTISAKNGSLLRLVPPGRFLMGSAPRDPGRRANEGRRLVQLQRPFYIGVAEITNVQFRKFHPEHTSGRVRGADLSLDLDAQPVAHISWDEAAAYCNWLSEQEGLPPAYERRSATYALRVPVSTGYRLPTEAEWEYACRALAEFALSDDQEHLEGDAWFRTNSNKSTHNVGQKRRNAFGFYDMRGNVSEWCWDIFDYYSTNDDVLEDPRGGGPPRKERVIRGGGWSNEPVRCRPANRYAVNPKERAVDLGFRVARDGALPGQSVRETVPK
jgi:formylglycine-generating enzyme required for sulfatase activity